MQRGLNAGIIRDIRKRSETQSTREIADYYQTSFEQIWRIVNNKIWKWVTDDVPAHATGPNWAKKDRKKLQRRKREELRRAACEPLSVEIWRALKQVRSRYVPDIVVKEIRRLADLSWPAHLISKRLNMQYQTVRSVAIGNSYKHVA